MSGTDEKPYLESTTNGDSFLVSSKPYTTLLVLLLVFLIFAAAGFGLHRPGFESRLVYDSAYFIDGQAALYKQHEVLKLMGMVSARPLFMLSFYVNYLAAGMEHYYFRVGNILFLAASGLALTLLAMIVFEMPGLKLPGTRLEKQAISILLGLLFVVHPLQTFVILYVWQREAIMACFFYFSGLAAYLATRSGRLRHATAAYFGSGVLFLAGMLSKENVATFPVVLLLSEVVLLRQGARGLLKRALPIAAIVIPVAAIYLLITSCLHGSGSLVGKWASTRIVDHYVYAATSPIHVVLTQTRILFSYLGMIVVPYDLEFMRPEILSKSLLNPPSTLPACLGWVGLLGTSFWMVRKKPLISFGILFYIVSLLPESLLIPQYLFYGYRAILPMLGVLLILGEAMLTLLAWSRAPVPSKALRASMAATASVVLVVFSAVTYSQARNWSPESFWGAPSAKLPPYSETLEMVPYLDISLNNIAILLGSKKYTEALDLYKRSTALPGPIEKTEDVNKAAMIYAKAFESQPMRAAGGLISLGIVLSGMGRFQDAVEPYRKALEIEPNHPDVRLSLGSIMEYLGNLPQAIEEYKKAIELDPWSASSYQTLGLALKRTGNLPAAAEEFWKAIQLDPRLASAHASLGAVYHEAGYLAEAAEQFKKAVEIDPNSADIYHKMGRAMAESGKLEQAISSYRKAVELNPSLAVAHADLALALEYSGNLPEALKEYKMAAELEPNSAIVHNLYGLALKKSGDLQEAIAHYRRAIEIDPRLVNARNNLGVALEKTGELKQAIDQYRKAIEINPASAIAYNNLGVALKKYGDKAAAIEQYKKAVTIDPYLAVAYDNMARALEN